MCVVSYLNAVDIYYTFIIIFVRLHPVYSLICLTCFSLFKGLSLHPLGDYVLSGSTDRHWAFSDINTGKTFCRLTEATQAGEEYAKKLEMLFFDELNTVCTCQVQCY